MKPIAVAAACALFPLLVSGARADAAADCAAAAPSIQELISCLQGEPRPAAPAACSDPPRAAGDPVAGKRTLRFGQATTYGNPSRGIVFEGLPGASVSTPVAGTVLFAGNFRSYGPLIIIDAGCATEALIAGPIAPSVTRGDTVTYGARLGTLTGNPSSTSPALYYELRKDGMPFDPDR